MKRLAVIALLLAGVAFTTLAGYRWPSDVLGSYVINPYRYAEASASFGVDGITWSSVQSVDNSNSYTLNLPATYVSGDLLIAAIVKFDDGSWQTPTGWTQLDIGGSGTFHYQVLAKVSDGTEGSSVEIDSSSGVTGDAIGSVIRVTAFQYTVATGAEIETQSEQLSSSLDFSSITPSWGTNQLWVIIGFWSDDNGTITSWPTNYDTNAEQAGTEGGANNSANLGISWRVNSATSESPSDATLSEVERNASATLAIRGS